ncbi:MAG: sugar transferase [Planctomycetes bacterium]|nr:sugar transferase [Planctomycetota bacterium]
MVVIANFSKRLFDLSASFLAVVLLLPVLIVISIIIKLGSKGPVLFRQERAGKSGKPFTLYKFRTMKVDVDPFGQSPQTGDDPRLIKAGKFLREYSLDELPQFFNVLKADMSLVGPRPLYLSQIAQCSENHKKRLLVRPGITGMSQIYARSELMTKRSLDLEVEYVEKQSFWFDIKILFTTVLVVLKKQDVYEES